MSLSGGIRFNEQRIAELRAAGLSEESAVAMDAELGEKDFSRPREKCILCLTNDAETFLPSPIASRDTRYQPPACNDCQSRLFVMLWDLPWLRYQITQYREVRGTRNYDPNGVYFGP